MSPSGIPNVGHSVFERLLNQARSRGVDFNLLLQRYGIERLLYRLSVSSHANSFILKGASLLLVWLNQEYRVTRDVDLLGFGPSDADRLNSVFTDLCQAGLDENDGIIFFADSIAIDPTREGQLYVGVRIRLRAKLHGAEIPIQVDVGFGDAITPAAERIEYPTLLGSPTFELLAIPRYTMIAEKLEAIVHLGIANTRLKDFYDVWLLSMQMSFEGSVLQEAIRNTFARRGTQIPEGKPVAFLDDFKSDPQKQAQWRAFVNKLNPLDAHEDLAAVVDAVAAFCMPAMAAAKSNEVFGEHWQKGGPWTATRDSAPD